MSQFEFSMGWVKDYPDIRDFTPHTSTVSDKQQKKGETTPIKSMLKTLKIDSDKPLKIPTAVDLRAWCSPIENQGALGSCTANAAVGVLEYFEKRAFGTYLDGSRLFTYKTTRDLLGWTGDTGAYLRTTMASMALFGVPLERYWPYNIAAFDTEPSAFLYAMGQDFKAISYYRLDPAGTTPANLLASIKNHAAAGIPSMFGFTCYSSLSSATNGKIPFPQPTERVIGGHAVVVVGYDDSIVINNGTVHTTGAFLIRNSWGTGWGMSGYGYLPYEYVLRGLAADFWVLINNQWVNTGNFGLI